MAKYSVTFGCGHEGFVNVIGPHKDRDWKIDRLASGLCPDCYDKYKQEEKARKAKEAEEKAKDWELPQLEGSENQIAWANQLRNNFIEEISKLLNCLDSKKSKRYLQAVDYIVNKELKASYWINNRNVNCEDILSRFDLKKETEYNNTMLEFAIIPKQVNHNEIVEILQQGDKIVAKCDKNEVARKIFKEVKLYWNGCWERTITETSGPIEDRIAELGNKLLNEGFRICIYDNDIRNKAINADYECECTRWIYKRKDTTKLEIVWEGYDDRLYNVSKMLSGAKWNKGMLVDVSYYEDIQDFAQQYGFKFTSSASKLIEQYKEEVNCMSKVEVANCKEKLDKDGLQDILKTKDEILDDLIEDD